VVAGHLTLLKKNFCGRFGYFLFTISHPWHYLLMPAKINIQFPGFFSSKTVIYPFLKYAGRNAIQP